jgi:hypothetical protein
MNDLRREIVADAMTVASLCKSDNPQVDLREELPTKGGALL